MFRRLLPASCLLVSCAIHAQEAEATLTNRGHRFEPAELRIPANGRAIIHVGPLAPGGYPFFGEFNPKAAIGATIA